MIPCGGIGRQLLGCSLLTAALVLFCGFALAAPTASTASYRVTDSPDATPAGTPAQTVPLATRPPGAPLVAPPVTPAPSPNNIGLELVFYSLVLILLLGAAIYFMRSGWPTWLLRQNLPRKLQVSEIRPLGNRQFLVVAEYETTKLLLGVSQGRIDLLCNLGREAMEGQDFAHLVSEVPPGEKP